MINNSTGGGVHGDMVRQVATGRWEILWEERVQGMDAGAEMCTLDAATLNLAFDGREILMDTPLSCARELAAGMKRRGIKPEWEVFSPTHILQDTTTLIQEGHDEEPYFVNLVMNVHRLQAALWREAFHLVDQGIATVEDVDTAIAHGPGLRWAVMGPFLNLHLSGGAEGIAHVLEHLGGPIAEWWKDLGSPEMTPALKAKVVAGVALEMGERRAEDLASVRDTLLLDLIRAKQRADAIV